MGEECSQIVGEHALGLHWRVRILSTGAISVNISPDTTNLQPQLIYGHGKEMLNLEER